MNTLPFRILIFVSTRGTTLKAVIEAFSNNTQIKIEAVIANTPCLALKKAQAAGIRTELIDQNNCINRSDFEDALSKTVQKYAADLIVLSGFMRVLSGHFIQEIKTPIINIHPSLLPKYGGKGMYGDKVHHAVLNAKESETGITIHQVDDGVDTGEILLQRTLKITDNDTVDSIKARVQNLEKTWYPQAITMIANSELILTL